jgi:hypothetical protein
MPAAVASSTSGTPSTPPSLVRGGSGCTGATAAVGTGKSLTEGTVVLNTTKCGSTYQLVDMTRGGGATNNMSLKTAGLGSVFTGTTNVWGDSWSATRRPWRPTPITAWRPPGITTRTCTAARASPMTALAR